MKRLKYTRKLLKLLGIWLFRLIAMIVGLVTIAPVLAIVSFVNVELFETDAEWFECSVTNKVEDILEKWFGWAFDEEE